MPAALPTWYLDQSMNRRTFMITGAWLATVAGGAWPSVALVDRTLACGPAFARYAAHLNLPLFETGDDIGTLWYTTLAPLLEPGSSLIGITRGSDYFVLHELAARAGLLAPADAMHEQPAASAVQRAHIAFTFTPRVLHHRA
jgi:hypothetical protein